MNLFDEIFGMADDQETTLIVIKRFGNDRQMAEIDVISGFIKDE